VVSPGARLTTMSVNRELDAARDGGDQHVCVCWSPRALALPLARADRAGYLDELA
jgi:hypothetical protein